MKRVLLSAAMAVFCSTLFAQLNITVGTYLQSPTPNSIKIMWRTDTTSNSKVVYGTDLANLNQTTIDTAITKNHMVKLTGLSAFTKYFYAVYDGSTLLEGADSAHWFRTFPVAGTELPIRAWAIGDFGKGNDKQRNVRDAYVNYAGNTETNLWLWLGDNVYDDGLESEYLTKVFDSVNGYRKLMTHIPFLPAPGNHDYNSISPVTNSKPPLQHTGPYYDFVEVYRNAEAGGVATNHELFYSFDYGNVHFVSLNSEVGAALGSAANDWTGASPFNTFTSSPLTTWLHSDLQANTKPWVIVYFHQPPYTDGSHESTTWYEVYMKAMRQNITPILEQYGVDLVICGHTHVYERSYLVHGAYGDPADITVFNFVQQTTGDDSQGQAYIKYTQGPNPNLGTVYVNNGNSGSDETDAGFNHPYMYSEYGCDTCCGSFVLDINGNRLDGRHIDMHGQERDHFTMYKINGSPNGVEELNNGVVSNLKVVPNPFRNATQIAFDLMKAGAVKIQLSDVAGKSIEIFNGNLQPGSHTYDINAEALKLAQGVYLLRISNGEKNIAKTVIRIN